MLLWELFTVLGSRLSSRHTLLEPSTTPIQLGMLSETPYMLQGAASTFRNTSLSGNLISWPGDGLKTPYLPIPKFYTFGRR